VLAVMKLPLIVIVLVASLKMTPPLWTAALPLTVLPVIVTVPSSTL
jgi:hypothetical protein